MPTRPPQHKPTWWKPQPNKRKEAQDPYYGTREWKALREQALQRDGRRCVMQECTTPNRGAGGRLIVDHILERKRGGKDSLFNLRTLCPTCDNRRHGQR